MGGNSSTCSPFQVPPQMKSLTLVTRSSSVGVAAIEIPPVCKPATTLLASVPR